MLRYLRASFIIPAALCLISLFFAESCATSRGSGSTAEPAAPTIHFLTFNMQSLAGSDSAVIVLRDHQTAQGVLKHQPQSIYPPYLNCYLYSGKLLLDSVKVEHPLYKHFEYPSGENTMASKDTLVDRADFFIRFQTAARVNEIRITESLPSRPVHRLATIKI